MYACHFSEFRNIKTIIASTGRTILIQSWLIFSLGTILASACQLHRRVTQATTRRRRGGNQLPLQKQGNLGTTKTIGVGTSPQATSHHAVCELLAEPHKLKIFGSVNKDFFRQLRSMSVC